MATTFVDNRYRCMDAIRGVAAIAIVFHHIGDMVAPLAMPGGYRAVDLFFVLSGFVLANSYQQRLNEGLTARQFMALRFVRLYPLFLLGALGGVGVTAIALVLGGGTFTPGQWITASVSLLAMLPSPTWPGLPQLTPLNVPAWSLILELVVNLAYALVAIRLTNVRLLLCILVSGLWLVWEIVQQGNSNMGSDWHTLSGGLARVFFSFSVGVLLARFKPRTRKWTWVAWLIPLAVAPLLYVVPQHEAVFDALCIFVIFPGLIALSAYIDLPGVRMANILGDMSYPIYILHVPVAMLYYKIFVVGGTSAGAFAPLSGLALLVALMVVSLLLERYYDRPVRRRLNAFLARKR